MIQIATAQIEGIQQYIEGRSSDRGQSARMFKDSALRIFPVLNDDQARKLYPALRCGLFHDGFTRGRIYVSRDYQASLDVKNSTLSNKKEYKYIYEINPSKYLDAVENDFDTYIKKLKEDAPSLKEDAPPLKEGEVSLRKKFLKMWNKAWRDAKEARYGKGQI